MNVPETLLLPQSDWPTCSRCQTKIPRFQLSPALSERLHKLLAQNRKTECVAVLKDGAGCDIPTAKTWGLIMVWTAFPERRLYARIAPNHSEQTRPNSVAFAAVIGTNLNGLSPPLQRIVGVKAIYPQLP
jgi:hypothetical protein